VGLKRDIAAHTTKLPASQQSHHCGIETAGYFLAETPDELQQSHHCGIETGIGDSVFKATESAAIAPLWD